ncbi:hypothetical protein CW368_10770 [Actinomycetales bacterium SN12]|nr:hypothetical protein CW368_10770 [Actinomycetales bacterium SN12]
MIHPGDEDGGFSLVELIVVVVVLGILAAIAIPILAGVEDTARHNALRAVVAEAAAGAVADLSQDATPRLLPDTGYSLDWADEAPTQADAVCVRATRLDNGEHAIAGPGCD